MTDQAARPERERDPTADAIGSALATLALAVRALWRLRLELAFGAPVLIGALMLAGEPLAVQACAAILLAAIARGAWPVLGPALQRARARRAWQTATDSLNVTIGRQWLGLRPAIRTVPAGEVLEVKVGRGMTVDALEKLAPALRDSMRVDDTRIERITGGRAKVLIRRRDPFADGASIPWPSVAAKQTSVRKAMPFGIDDLGRPITIEPLTGHVLIAGATRSGKSVALSMFLGWTGLDPNARLILLDGKLVHFGPAAPIAAQFIGGDIIKATRALETVRAVIDERYPALLAEGLEQIRPGMPTYHVFIDELSTYAAHGDQKRKAAFNAALLDILQRGLAAGVQVTAAMQRPEGKLLNTNIRAQFGWRICFRVSEAETTRMMFEGEGAEPHRIRPGTTHRGVCYLQIEGESDAVRAKAYHVTKPEMTAIIERAVMLRLDQDPDDPRNEPSATIPGPITGLEPPRERTPPPPPPDPPSTDTRSVLDVLSDDEREALSCARITRTHGEWPGLEAELQRLCEAGAVGAKRGPGRGGVPVYWRKGRDPGNSDYRVPPGT